MTNTTFIKSLKDAVNRQDANIFATWYDSKGNVEKNYSFDCMWKEAGAIAQILRIDMNLQKGDRVVLCYNFGLQFFAAFLGCIRAGVTAVLVYPPSPSSLSKTLPKMSLVANDCAAKCIFVDSDINRLRKADMVNPMSKSRQLWPKDIEFKNVHSKIKGKKSKETDSFFDDESLQNEDIAFLQYTSGSTGKPKGVMVSYGALDHNIKSIIEASSREYDKRGMDRDKIVCFSWLPQYHDMGLISATIAPFAAGWRSHMMSPVSFIKNPLLWIDLMSKHKVTWSVAPDFAYRLVARKFMDAKERKKPGNTIEDTDKGPFSGLDLSSIVRLYSAAEPIREDTVTQFRDAFAEYGLPKKWFGATYGLAENVVYVCGVDKFELSTFQPSGHSLVAVAHQKDFFSFGETIKIVCPTSLREVMGEREVGELWISCPSKASGYFGRPQLSNETFLANITGDESNKTNYLRTGDLSFIEDGYLYICGRHKDLVIVNGVNYYPQDIEYVIQEASAAVRPGCMAAFSSDDAGGDGDLEVVFEIRNTHTKDTVEVINIVYKAIVQDIGLIPKRVVAIKEKSIPKTTSGKIQRKATRENLHDNKLKVLGEYSDKGRSANPVILSLQSHSGPNDSKNKYARESTLQEAVTTEEANDFDWILTKYFGDDVDYSMSWEELGMSSMASVQLRDSISDSMLVTLAPDCFELYPTPIALRDHICQSQGSPLEVDLLELKAMSEEDLAWSSLGCLQFLCSISLLLILAMSVIPTYFLGKILSNNASITVKSQGNDSISIQWTWVPLAVPVWMLVFSLNIVALKWLIVGKYVEGIYPVQSIKYLGWWYVDRAVSLWEFWVGRFIQDTPLINLFYSMMGAKIHHSAAIDAFVRDFDLVEISGNTSIQHPINCHRFSPWDGNAGASVRFRPISVGRDCTIKGMVSLGAKVGDGAYIEKLSVMTEGSRAPSNGHIMGNPSFSVAGVKEETVRRHSWWVCGILKIFWLIFELYLFFGVILLGQYLWVTRLPTSDAWRYASLVKWILLVLWCGTLSIGTSICIKWILIGKRRPGTCTDTLLKSMADWAADWHYRASTSILLSFTSNSRMWNVILMLHGMDIDCASKIQGHSFVPSKMDLVKVRKSFISVVSFVTQGKGRYHNIEVEESTIGFFVHAGPADLKIKKSLVSPLTHVTRSIIGGKVDERISECFAMGQIMREEAVAFLFYVLSFGLFALTLVPSFEVYTRISVNEGSSILFIVPALAAALILQCIAWTLVLVMVQYVAQLGSRTNKKPWNDPLYAVFLTANFAQQNWSCVRIFHGSPTYNFIVWILGGNFEGRAILLPRNAYEYPFITFADKTIISNADVNGHFVVFNDINLGPSKISGVVHDGAYIANALVTANKESGPWRGFVATYDTSGIDASTTLRIADDNVDTDHDESSNNDPTMIVIPHSIPKPASGMHKEVFLDV